MDYRPWTIDHEPSTTGSRPQYQNTYIRPAILKGTIMEPAMILNLVIGVILYVAIIYLLWRTTHQEAKEEYGERMMKVWGGGVYYWQWILIFSGGITVFIMFLLKEVGLIVL